MAWSRSFVPVSGRTRSNITIAEADGTVTKLNEPGPTISDAELEALSSAIAAAVSAGDWVVISGSMPPEFTGERFVALVSGLVGRGIQLAIDTSGDALVASLDARPRLIKPNRAELAELVGRPLASIADVIEAARGIHGLRRRDRAGEPRRRRRSARRPGRGGGRRITRRPAPAARSARGTASSPASSPSSRWMTRTCKPPSSRPSPGARQQPRSQAPRCPRPRTSTTRTSSWCRNQTWIGHSWPAEPPTPSRTKEYQPQCLITHQRPPARVPRRASSASGRSSPAW